MVETLGETLRFSEGKDRKAGQATPRPQLFLALELDRPTEAPARFSLADIDEVIIGRGSVRGSERQAEEGIRRLRIKVPDRWMSSTHARLGKVFGRWVIGDAGSKNGTVVNGALTKNTVLGDGDLIECGHTFFLFRQEVAEAPEGPAELGAAGLAAAPAPGMATLVAPFARRLAIAAQVAPSPVSVILRGESGTGKEVVARALHRLSRRPGEFIPVNCGALPENLIETELFGHKKGSFSGATEDRIGLVRAADRGTLFLDEIGDLPLSSQVAFLRVLQEGEVTPVGATRPVAVDIRLIAATHRDLDELVREERFRADLYARISGFTLDLPPLRERREDLGLLVGTLLLRLAPAQAHGVRLSLDAGRAIFRHPWPLNVRELEKALGAAVVLAAGGSIELEHLPEAVRASLLQPPPEATPVPSLGAALAEPPLSDEDRRRRGELAALLREHQGNISAVARVMGKARMQIQRWVKRYGLDPESYRRG